MRKIIVGLVIGMLVVLSIYLTHATPELAIRTKLFENGFYQESISASITKKSDSIYEVNPAPVQETYGELKEYVVDAELFYYTADYHWGN